MEPIIDALGHDTTVLRLTSVNGGSGARDGQVSYQLDTGEPHDDHPLRAPWARPGGPQAMLDWAEHELNGQLTGPAVQVKTWNLSCVYRLSTRSGPVWLKANPQWACDESATIDLVRRQDPGLVADLLASKPHLTLTANAPGVIGHRTGVDVAQAVVRRWVAVQAALARTELGAPVDVLSEFRRFDGFPVDGLPELAARLPELLAELDSAGLPTTLVHGDLHPGNWIADGGQVKIIDWSDSYVGHPAADIARLHNWLSEAAGDAVVDTWVRAWRSLVPGSSPRRALAPMRVLGPVLDAITYQRFLDNIEPSERIYHAEDPVDELTDAVHEALSH